MEVTNEFLASLPKPDIEFKSNQKFLDEKEENIAKNEYHIVGWITYKTSLKWGLELQYTPARKERTYIISINMPVTGNILCENCGSNVLRKNYARH